MHAAVVHSFDAPPRYEEFPDPVPSEDEVLVNIAAAGYHRVVQSIASGAHYGSTAAFPFIPGVDGVGRLDDGTRVFFGAARHPFGTFAERGVAARSRYLPVPDALDDATVAAMMNPGMASWSALTERAQFAAGESILILGATGTAGQLAVQVARRLGAKRIVASGRNPQALAELPSLGADAVISLEQERDALVAAFRDEIAGNRIDVVLDYLWGAPAEAVLAAIARKGLQHAAARIRYVQVGSSAGPNISLPAATLRSSGLELMGSGFGSVSLERIFRSLARFVEEAARQPFHFRASAAPLSEVAARWNQPRNDGRLVFVP